MFEPGLRSTRRRQCARIHLANQFWRVALSRADGLIAISEAVRSSALACLRLHPQTMTVVYRAARGEIFGTWSPRRRNELVALGRLVPQKGHDVLIQALAQLAKRRDDWTCKIVGEGWWRSHLNRLIDRHGLHQKVTLPGVSEDPHLVLREASLFVFPSRYEGLGVSVLEAAAIGVPMILSDIPVLREIVGPESNASFFPAGDSKALANTLEGVLRHADAAAARATLLREHVRRTFAMDTAVEATLETYEAAKERSIFRQS